MSIYIYTSNLLENLALKFSINRQADTSVFDESLIVTETEGMGWWLAIQTAKNNGIAANFEFVQGHSLIQRIFSMAGLRSDKAYSKQNLKWLLFTLLDEADFKTRFPLVSGYYSGDHIKRFQLAVEVATLFDRYMVYRSDYIEAWDKGQHITLDEANESKEAKEINEGFKKHEDWQCYLWAALKRNVGEETTNKVVLKAALLEKLATPKFQKRIKESFSQLNFFGLSQTSPYYMEIYNALGKIIDLHFYICDASPETDWHDRADSFEVLDNELFDNLNVWGKEVLCMMKLLDSDLCTWDKSLAELPEPKSLLGKIKNDIYQNDPNFRNPITDADLQDETIRIASSFTPARELEALYNYLLHMFEKDDSLLPHDIVVHLTDVEKYTPYIQAIFDNAPVKIPYSIADRSFKGDDTIVGILDQLLRLSEDDFTSEIVLQLLDSHFIRDKFGIRDVDFIRQLVRESNVRLSIDGRTEDETRFVSWRYGLQRMLLGYAIKGGEAYQSYDDSLYPMDTFEGNSGLEMLRFKAFVDTLIDALEKRKGLKSLSTWNQYILEDMLEGLIAFDNDSNDEYQHIVKHLEGLADIDEVVAEEMTYQVFYNSFQTNLFSESRKGHFVNGRLTFCSLIPMRSVPFKLVAMLGLDSDKFPRDTSKKGFDLTSFERRSGDVNAKLNDRYLFLENILSARECLYLSYLGNSVKNSSEQPASLLLDELLSYIDAGNENAEKELLTSHPLQLFSKQYFTDNSKYYNYLKNWDDVDEPVSDKQPSQMEDVDLSKPKLIDLIRFCKDPFKFYYNKTLRVNYDEEEVLLPETELFELDGLQSYHTKMAMINISDDGKEAYRSEGKKTGFLPLANMTDICLDKLQKEVDPIRQQLEPLIADCEKRSIALDLSFTNGHKCELTGEIDNIYGDKHICVNVSSESGKHKYIIEAYIKHLFLMANDCNIETLFIGKYTEQPVVFPARMLSARLAASNLHEIIALYKLGYEKIILFLPDVGFYLQSKRNGRSKYDEDKALKEIREKGKAATGWPNKYIAKEIETGVFAKNTYDDSDKEHLMHLSNLLFADVYDEGIFIK